MQIIEIADSQGEKSALQAEPCGSDGLGVCSVHRASNIARMHSFTMNVIQQLLVLEPKSSQLLYRRSIHLRQAKHFALFGHKLKRSGAFDSSLANYFISDTHREKVLVCDSALQFEKLAGLS